MGTNLKLPESSGTVALIKIDLGILYILYGDIRFVEIEDNIHFEYDIFTHDIVTQMETT